MWLVVVGGIYTVIRSKAAVTMQELGDQLIMLGPYNEATVKMEVELMEPENELIKATMDGMKEKGIKVSNYH